MFKAKKIWDPMQDLTFFRAKVFILVTTLWIPNCG